MFLLKKNTIKSYFSDGVSCYKLLLPISFLTTYSFVKESTSPILVKSKVFRVRVATPSERHPTEIIKRALLESNRLNYKNCDLSMT